MTDTREMLRRKIARRLCEQSQDVWADGKRYWLAAADEILAEIAQGTEAQRAETENTGSVHDGPVAEPCAPTQSGVSNQ